MVERWDLACIVPVQHIPQTCLKDTTLDMKTTLEFNTHNLPYVLLVVVAGFLILVSRFLEKECAFTARNGIVRPHSSSRVENS